jgi:rare lipoprotein A
MPQRRHHCRRLLRLSLALLAPPLILIGCGGVPLSNTSEAPRAGTAKKPSALPSLPAAGSGRGGYYLDDGPGEAPPEGLLDTPDAVPKVEPYATRGNQPYEVFGKSYTPLTDERPFKQRGIGSWYGRKFHGQKTSSGEPYDMYKMTAAHPTLPIPSYVRVTNLANGKQVILRVNDRGPFHSNRIIDLSYTAALKLGYLGKGSSELEVERLLPEQIARINAERKDQATASAAPSTAVEVLPVAATDALVRTEIQPLPAAEAVPPAATASASASASAAGAYYLQLGAFSQAANADAARKRLQQELAPGQAALEVVGSGNLYRLYSGPYPSRAEAAAAAPQLQGTAKPMIVQR